MPVRVRCPCGNSLRVTRESLGKRVRCPVCGRFLRIAGPTGTGRSAIANAPTPAEGDDDLKLAEDIEPRRAQDRPCPACAAPVSQDARICVACGYNLVNGKQTRRRVGVFQWLKAPGKEGWRIAGLWVLFNLACSLIASRALLARFGEWNSSFKASLAIGLLLTIATIVGLWGERAWAAVLLAVQVCFGSVYAIAVLSSREFDRDPQHHDLTSTAVRVGLCVTLPVLVGYVLLLSRRNRAALVLGVLLLIVGRVAFGVLSRG